MDKVQWLFAVGFLLLLGGLAYTLHTGSVTAGPWTFSRQQSPVHFYVTAFSLFAVGALVGLTGWFLYRP